MEKPTSLAGRIAKISAEIGAVDKTGRNSQQNYNFIEYAEIAAKIRALQEQYGVTIIPQVESYTKDEVHNKFGGLGYHYLLNMSFRAINADDKEDYIEVKWVGESTDYGDKGINKAITAGVKYFMMRLYNISEKGEKDADKESPEQFATSPDFIKATQFQLAKIDNEDELNALWKSLTQTDRKTLIDDFSKRKKEILESMEGIDDEPSE